MVTFDNWKQKNMDKKSRFPIRRFDSLEALKDEEYRYWQGRPASERLARYPK